MSTLIEKVAFVLRYTEVLNEWEAKFIRDINGKMSINKDILLSPKQLKVIDTLYTDIQKSIVKIRQMRAYKGNYTPDWAYESLDY